MARLRQPGWRQVRSRVVVYRRWVAEGRYWSHGWGRVQQRAVAVAGRVVGAAAGGEGLQLAAADHRPQPARLGVGEGEVQAAAGGGLQAAGAQRVEVFQQGPQRAGDDRFPVHLPGGCGLGADGRERPVARGGGRAR